MTIQTNFFEPDTCNCRIEYEYDDAEPLETRVHRLKRVHRRGEEHASIIDASIFTVVLEEAGRKNKALGILEELEGVLPDGDVTWLYTPGRTLSISLPKLNQARRNAMQNLCDTRLGLGKVIITS